MYEDLSLELYDAIRDRALPVRGMMTDEERRVLERLPDMLTVYRGTFEGARPGWSWSLRRRTAARFWYGKVDTLITGRVEKSRVIGLKLGRGEHEILSFDVREVARERI